MSDVIHGPDGTTPPLDEISEPVHSTDLARLAPGLPEHAPRRTDVDLEHRKHVERVVAGFFGLSMLATIGFVAAFIAWPTAHTTITIIPGLLEGVSASNFFLGLALAAALLTLGFGAILWARQLMGAEEYIELRHGSGSNDEQRQEFQQVFERGVDSSGLKEFKLLRRTLLGGLALLPIPVLLMLRDTGPLPRTLLRHTIIEPGVRLVVDGVGTPLKPEDIPPGSLVNAVPENLEEVEEEEGTLNARAKATLMIIRMRPDQIVAQQGEDWDIDGILCFSKVCTHVGCPLGLYEQTTHHMLCPCHQSTFDLADMGNVIFGPAARRLPQLPIEVDDEGYIVARSDFEQPVGPSFWERG